MHPATKPLPLPPLRHGELLSQAEFHRRYEAHPDDTKFELIGGVVRMASPTRNPHARLDPLLSYAPVTYAGATPGTQTLGNVTTILGESSELQPDAILRILPSHGGRTRDEDDYTHNGPELVAQISHSSLALDLGDRRTACEAAGVREYLVVDIPNGRLRWFDLAGGGEIPLRGGVMRSRAFPGLWLAPAALLASDIAALTAALQPGLASAAHARFVERLERARRGLA